MNIKTFICGMLVALIAVIAASWIMGWSAWAIIGMSVATLVLAQVFYVSVIVAQSWMRGTDTAKPMRPASHNRTLH
jgi:ABC-type transport system involved in cytochrome bd biosynthesis fused ATPase/permease subunit